MFHLSRRWASWARSGRWRDIATPAAAATRGRAAPLVSMARTMGSEGSPDSESTSTGPIVHTRTRITQQLWEARQASAKLVPADVPAAGLKPSQTEVTITLPFASDQATHDTYVNFDGHLRTGLLLEDMDALAANVANAHAQLRREEGYALVTASVDSIHVLAEVEDLVSKDVVMTGCVSWVGRSSIEVELEIFQESDLARPIVVATFVMVAKDVNTGKSVAVTPLLVETDAEKRRFAAGAARNQRRKLERKTSLYVAEPTSEEVALVHDMLIRGNEEHLSSKAAEVPVAMADARMDSTVLTQPQERNFSGNIFGGWLMRKAFEIARANAYMHCAPSAHHSYPVLAGIDDILFLHPVTLGQLLKFQSSVSYSERGAILVEVETRASTLQEATKPVKVTNRFHFTFGARTKDELALDVPQVKPHTYREAIHYLDGRRRLKAAKSSALETRSDLLTYFL